MCPRTRLHTSAALFSVAYALTHREYASRLATAARRLRRAQVRAVPGVARATNPSTALIWRRTPAVHFQIGSRLVRPTYSLDPPLDVRSVMVASRACTETASSIIPLKNPASIAGGTPPRSSILRSRLPRFRSSVSPARRVQPPTVHVFLRPTHERALLSAQCQARAVSAWERERLLHIE